MKARPVLFNAEMVRAILDGRKTQTRRILANQPTTHYDGFTFEAGKHYPHIVRGGMTLLSSEGFGCPFGQVGDRLWVREKTLMFSQRDGRACVRYLADNTRSTVDFPSRLKPVAIGRCLPNGCYREASRITLEITDVRVERLRSMSQQDARSEGVIAASGPMEAGLAFRQLWESIYGAESWQANPWVWVIEFKRVEAQGWR